jgi:hypothetical protein
MVLGWIEEDGNWTEITGQIPFSTASADRYRFSRSLSYELVT